VLSLTVAVCTRNRPRHVARTLDALMAQSRDDFDALVIDQSEESDAALEWRAARRGNLRVIRDPGRGLSRARNLASASVDTKWIAFVDDDCILAPDWVEQLAEVVISHPQVDFVAGHVEPSNLAPGDQLAAAARPVSTERIRHGRWTRPNAIGFGVCMVVRRDVVVRLRGWDERMGAGVPEFPAAEDIDFNYRLLRAGGTALATPRLRAAHEQWRTRGETVSLYRGYGRSWAGFAMKHVRSGDVLGGLWLWLLGLESIARLLAGATRNRRRLRAVIAIVQLREYWHGTALGAVRRW
jgi:GT2 family glycosyltransferase